MKVAQQPDVRLDNQLCFALYAASNAIEQHYHLLLKTQDLTYSQFLVLMALAEQDGISITSLAKRLELSRSTMTPMLRRLEAKGLLIREMEQGNERQKIVSLTKKGRRIWIKSCSASSEVFERTGLTKKEADEMIRVCMKIARGNVYPTI